MSAKTASNLKRRNVAKQKRLLLQRKRIDEQLNRLSAAPRRRAGLGQPVVRRVIRWFERDGDELVGSAPLRSIALADLQRMFGVDRRNPMFDCFPITAIQATQLQAYVDVALQLDRFEYFVEADALPTGKKTR